MIIHDKTYLSTLSLRELRKELARVEDIFWDMEQVQERHKTQSFLDVADYQLLIEKVIEEKEVEVDKILDATYDNAPAY